MECDRSAKSHTVTTCRVFEDKLGGVQENPIRRCPAVERVAQDRKALRAGMHPNLMRAACEWFGSYQGQDLACRTFATRVPSAKVRNRCRVKRCGILRTGHSKMCFSKLAAGMHRAGNIFFPGP